MKNLRINFCFSTSILTTILVFLPEKTLVFSFLIKVDLKRQDLENAQMSEVGCKQEEVE